MQHQSTAATCAAAHRRQATALAIAALFAVSGTVQAFDIDVGNPDLAIRFDNTVRLNYGVRVESRDSKIGNSALADEGDYSFDNGDAIALIGASSSAVNPAPFARA